MKAGKEGSEQCGEANRCGRQSVQARERWGHPQANLSEALAIVKRLVDLAAERERRAEERELRAAIRTRNPPKILDTLTERRATFSRGDLNRALVKVRSAVGSMWSAPRAPCPARTARNAALSLPTSVTDTGDFRVQIRLAGWCCARRSWGFAPWRITRGDGKFPPPRGGVSD
jgi:hypothetical protein